MAEHGGKEPETEAGGEASPRPDSGIAAVALARAVGRGGGKSDPRMDAFLEKQTRLIDLQMEHLHDERELQHRHGRLKFLSERLKVGLQFLTMAVGLALAIGAGAMAWSAAHENGLVIEAFSVPPDLAARGITGKVVASKLLDEMTRIQAQVVSGRAASTYSNSWTGDIRVEIPETGVSIGEVRRLLVDWLGHQTTVDGEVYRTPAGLVVAARAGQAAAVEHVGPDGDLDALVKAAAEEVIATTQPYRYSIYLRAKGRFDDAWVILNRLSLEGSPTDRAWAVIGLAFKEPTKAGNIATFERAARLDPHLALPWGNMSNSLRLIGQNEAARAPLLQALKLIERRDRGGIAEDQAATLRHTWRAWAAQESGDLQAAEADWALAATTGADGNLIRSNSLVFQAQTRALNHDPSGARSLLPPGQTDAALSRARFSSSLLVTANAMSLRAMEDWPAAYQQFAGADALWRAPASIALMPQAVEDVSGTVWPYMAEALAHMGRMDEARALIEQTPATCYLCVRMRGQIAAIGGDRAAADHWYAEAGRQGPSLPFAEAEWAQVLLARGDANGAMVKAKAANRKGPHFADPLEVWGEVLLKQGDAKAAALKFAEADKYAPKWGRNHLMWGQALAKQGKTADARAQFAAAAGMDLTAADRAELAKAQGHG